jgi:hypothetical protein
MSRLRSSDIESPSECSSSTGHERDVSPDGRELSASRRRPMPAKLLPTSSVRKCAETIRRVSTRGWHVPEAAKGRFERTTRFAGSGTCHPECGQ